MNKCVILIESQLFYFSYSIVQKIQEYGYRVVLICRDINIYVDAFSGLAKNHLLEADCIIRCETNDVNQLVDVIKKTQKDVEISAILSFSDYYVEIASKLCKLFNINNENLQTVTNIKRKSTQYQILANKGIRIPRTEVLNLQERERMPLEAIQYPCIVKPDSDSSSHGVTFIQNPEELEKYIYEHRMSRFNERMQLQSGILLVQEFIEGEEISVEVFTENGRRHILGFTSKKMHKNTFAEKVFSFPYSVESFLAKEIKDYVYSVLDALNVTFGCSHIEIKINRGIPILIEVNPRLGGRYISKMIEDVYGFNCFLETFKLSILGAKYVFPQEQFASCDKGAAYNVLYSDEPGTLISSYELGLHNLENAELLLVKKDYIRAVNDNSDAFGYIYCSSVSAARAEREVQNSELRLGFKVQKNG